MSILNQSHIQQVEPAVRAARNVKQSTSQLANSLVSNWIQGFDKIWNNPRATPEEILAELGTDAGEVMELSTELVTFLASVLPTRLPDEWAAIQTKLSEKPATTTNPDGTVSID